MEWKESGNWLTIDPNALEVVLLKVEELEAERDRLRALLAEVGEGEPIDENEDCVYCEEPLMYNGMKHLPTCITVRIKAELAGGSGHD